MLLLRYACDAVSVLQRSPYQNDPSSAIVYVGSMGRGFSIDTAHTAHGQCITLLQFPPLKLPAQQMITSIRLCMLVYSSGSCVVQIGVFQNLAPFDAKTVNFFTKPAIAYNPVAALQVGPDNQSSYVTCDLKMPFKDHSDCLPGFGLSLIPIYQQRGMAAFYAQEEVSAPYLEITLCPREEKNQPSGPDDGLAENIFREWVFDIYGKEQELFTPVLYTAGVRIITFFIRNDGDHSLDFCLQLSPDGREYLNDQQNFSVKAGEMKAATPYLFGKFMRVFLCPTQSGQGISARVWCQAQMNNYMVKGGLQAASRPSDSSALSMSLT